MNILHIASIRDLPQSGVVKVVPGHVKHQGEYANVALLNIDSHIPVDYKKSDYKLFRLHDYPEGITGLPRPFCDPDLVVFHEVYWPPFLGMARYCRKNGIPYIITPHVSLTKQAQRRKWLKKIIGNVLLFNRYVSGAAAIHFLSQSEKDQTGRFTGKPYFICSNGIDTRPRLKRKFNKNKLRLIYVGRLKYKVKGVDRILDAVNIAQENMRELDIHVALYGPSGDEAAEKIDSTISKYGIDDLVTVGRGLFGDEKVQEIISNDCFIQLSRTEGQPLGIMEAMDLGMPCIVTHGTSFYDVVQEHEAGIAVADNPQAIADEIVRIREGGYDLELISANASRYAKRAYGWRQVAQQMIQEYEKIKARS